MSKNEYKSQSARDAQRINYGDSNYWQYLDDSAQESSKYYKEHGNEEKASLMLTRSLWEALQNNDGE